MASNHHTDMTVLKLSPEFVADYNGFQVPWGPLGYVTYKRTYARPVIPEAVAHVDGFQKQLDAWREHVNDSNAHFRTEEWWETAERCVNWVLAEAKGAISIEEGEKLFDDVLNLRCSFAGRGLWQYGTETVKNIGAASLNNCYAVNVDSLDSFLFTFDMLMLGGGVGFNIQKENVYSLPKVTGGSVVRRESKDAEFIVPDSREGWIELLRRVLDVYFTDQESLTYSTVCIRPQGSPIAGFGGTASGPGPLCLGIEQICAVLDARKGKKLRPMDCLDIMNIIGSVVVAGNVRRSAELALGDFEDTHFLLAKRFDLSTPVPNWRSMSNNSVACSRFDHLPNAFWKTYDVGGEPYGLVNLGLMRQKGRLIDTHRKDEDVIGTNPCAEISLESGESCNLAEIYLPNIESEEQLIEVATRIWKVCKVVSCVPHHWPFAAEIIEKNHRTGLGITGVLQAKQFENLPDVLDQTYKALEQTDEAFSKALTKSLDRKIGTSIKLTTVKPSGTLSLLAGVSSGIHPEYSEYYIRRIRIAANSPIVEASRKAGYQVEQVLRFDGSKDPSTYVVEFPCKAREGSVLAKDMTAIEQLEVCKMVQTYWSDNSVSVTVYYRKEELDAIKEWMSENYDNSLKSVSFLQHSEHGFVQAPLEEIDEKEFTKRSKGLVALDLSSSHDEAYDDDCATGACPVR